MSNLWSNEFAAARAVSERRRAAASAALSDAVDVDDDEGDDFGDGSDGFEPPDNTVTEGPGHPPKARKVPIAELKAELAELRAEAEELPSLRRELAFRRAGFSDAAFSENDYSAAALFVRAYGANGEDMSPDVIRQIATDAGYIRSGPVTPYEEQAAHSRLTSFSVGDASGPSQWTQRDLEQAHERVKAGEPGAADVIVHAQENGLLDRLQNIK